MKTAPIDIANNVLYFRPINSTGFPPAVSKKTIYVGALSKKLDLKFLPKLHFVEDNSFEYAEKIEKLIKENRKNDTEKKRFN